MGLVLLLMVNGVVTQLHNMVLYLVKLDQHGGIALQLGLLL